MSLGSGSAPQPWQTRRSDVVIADRWISLRADECVGAGGQVIAPYYVLDYGDWVSVLAIDTSGDAVLVEEYRQGAGVVALGTVGGGVIGGETPDSAAYRELCEETGYEAGSMIHLGATWANFGNHTNRVHHFVALDCRRVTEQSLDESEDIRVRVVPFVGLGNLLHQSYHQLTWYKAEELLRSRNVRRPAG
ncbi:NUDIX hydrolase [Microbacterium sp. NPDC008134]|uniref:NUDIX hydrolase n=1 Tax=Microbacterium sp. NPDC008134 TaxID=3364183 RepID=UPI0036F16E9D